jgi:hypothetical protein
MLKKLYFIALIVGINQASFAQARPEDNLNAPKIVFNKTIHDFGELIQNAPAVCEFKFYNKGKSPLIVLNVHASCGCTIPSWSSEPIMPGDSGVIRVKYSTAAQGAIDKLIDVSSNATSIALALKLKGKVVKK